MNQSSLKRLIKLKNKGIRIIAHVRWRRSCDILELEYDEISSF